MPFDSTPDPTTDIILGAIEYLERHGWCQGAVAQGDNVCIVGAVRAVGGSHNPAYGPAMWRISRAIDNLGPAGVIAWNDAAGRTKEEVIEVLYKSLG